MLPWRRNSHRVVVSRRQLELLDAKGDSTRVVAVTATTSIADALDQLLAESDIKEMSVVLSTGLVDFLVLPGLERWLRHHDLDALARSRLERFYGNHQDQRQVTVAREGYATPCVCASVEQNLLNDLLSVARRRRVRIAGIWTLVDLLLAGIRHQLQHRETAAVCVEEPEGLWIGLFRHGEWVSARSIPVHLLGSGRVADLLERECLSAGIATPAHLWWGSLEDNEGSSRPANAELIDIRHKFPNGGLRGELNFLKPNSSSLGWGLLVAALVATIASTAIWSEQEDRRLEMARMMEGKMRQDQVAGQRRQDFELKAAADHGRALAAYRLQMAPWDKLIDLINTSAEDAVELSHFQADVSERSLKLEGAAKRFEDIQEFIDRLKKQPELEGIEFLSAAPREASVLGNVHFSISAKWNPWREQ